jgi:hypothetical protein
LSSSELRRAGMSGASLAFLLRPAQTTWKSTPCVSAVAHSEVKSISASIDSIYISQPDPAGKPYDSLAPNPAGTGLTKIADSLVISVGSGPNPPPYVLTPVLYSLDRTQPLLIAFQFSSPPTLSGIRYALVPAPPPPLATAYYFLGAEAALTDRSPGYTPVHEPRLYLIAKIEVG